MGYQEDDFYIRKVLDGDVRAFANLVDKHKDMVYTIALKLTRNHEDAEEIAQDTFVKIYRSLGDFRKMSRFSTWLYRITYNTAISFLRSRKPEPAPITEDMVETATVDEIGQKVSEMEIEEQRRIMQLALSLLPEEDNLLVTLYYLDDRPVAEISEIMGLTQTNVKVRLHRNRKRLYALLNKYYQ
ncbi:MAG: RNA polymerase sigma factor [Bacteroidales bacterium]|jgi:RNA polymerase sigma-70 factor (ECF subfamily)|nr:RNA polymerase sigma factor [Bacteroidales bacterium]